MKKLLFLILLLFTVNITFSQITTNVSLKCQIYASSGTAPTFNVQSLVSDELSKYDGSSVAAGDKLFIIDGSECYELHISSITLGSGSVLNFVAYDSTGVLTTIPNGQAAVIRKYSTQQVPFIPAGLRSDLASCILQKIASTVNSVTGSGVDNCTKTITQTAHGFSDGDVLYWDETLSEYVTFVGNYANASWPVYVVLDSLTANTFTGVSCGIIDKDFSLPEGLYYATNTGLSLTPAAIEYPVLKVYDGEAQVLALPGLEFDATGKELLDIVTPTGQRTVSGGDVLDLHADSTRVNITIADTVATSVGHALELLKNNGSADSNLDSLAALPDVVGINVLNADILERDSINNRWVNKNYHLRHVNNSIFLGQGTPKITNHTNFMAIGYNALNGYSAAGSPNGVFTLGNSALSRYNVANTETNAPFAIGNGALKNYVGTGTLTTQFAIGNNAGLNSVGNANGTNWLVGNRAGISLTTGWGNMLAGDGIASAGRNLTTGVGNTIFAVRGFGNIAGGNNYLTNIGFDNDLYGTVTSATNTTVSGSGNTFANAVSNYITMMGSVNRAAANNETLIGYYNGLLGTRSMIGTTLIGTTNFAPGLGTHTTYDLGYVVGIGSHNGTYAKVSNSIGIGRANLAYTQSNFSISIGLNDFFHGGSSGYGYNSVKGDSLLLIGNYTSNTPIDSATTKTSSIIDPSNENITVTSHGFGGTGTFVMLNTTCNTCPSPFTTNNWYGFEVINANTLKSVINLTTAGDSLLTLRAKVRANNAIVLGHNIVPEERKIKFGNTAHTNIIANRYNFNIDQLLSSANDKQALRYNHSSGEIEVMNAGSNADLVTAEQTENVTAIKFQIMPVNTTSIAVTITPPSSPVAGDWFAVSDSRGQAATNNITIDTSTDKLHGASDDHVISTAKGFVRLTYVNSTVGWIITN